MCYKSSFGRNFLFKTYITMTPYAYMKYSYQKKLVGIYRAPHCPGKPSTAARLTATGPSQGRPGWGQVANPLPDHNVHNVNSSQGAHNRHGIKNNVNQARANNVNTGKDPIATQQTKPQLETYSTVITQPPTSRMIQNASLWKYYRPMPKAYNRNLHY